VLAAELQAMRTLIASIEKRIIAHHRLDEASKRLRSIPGIGLVGATAIAATITDPKAFRSGRDLAAWIGLVPRQDSTGGKPKLGPISKQGDRYLRRILVIGAHAVLKLARQKPEKYPWLTQLLARKPFKIVAVALANKMARIAWALLVKGRPVSGACTGGSGLTDWRWKDEVAYERSRTARVMTTLMRNGRDRRSENPLWADAIVERVFVVGTDQRITSGPAATAAASRQR
jgi:hypothetical protein